MINKELLLENADALTVALHIGMEVVSKGHYHQILCPGHLDHLGKYDNKIGNAIITSKGYFCFACNRSVGIIDMVQEYYKNYLGIELDFKSTLEIIAETCGGVEMYSINNEELKNTVSIQRNIFILNKKELELIGISLNANNMMVTNSSEKYIQNDKNKYKKYFTYNKEINDFNVEYLQYYSEPVSIYTYYNEDKYSCIEMLLEKTNEKKEEIKSILKMIDNIDINTIFNNKYLKEENIMPIMKDILLKQFYSCKTIEEKLQKEIAENTNEVTTTIVLNNSNELIYQNLYDISNVREEGPF